MLVYICWPVPADIAQPVERILGKDEVPSSNLGISSSENHLKYGGFFVRLLQKEWRMWDNEIHSQRPHPFLCHIQRHILLVVGVRKPLYFNGCRRPSKITRMSHRHIFNTVKRRNGLYGIFQLSTSLDIVLQSHSRCCMTCCCLRLFYVFCDFVNIRQYIEKIPLKQKL